MYNTTNTQSFDSGAIRDTAAEKPRPDLISPLFEQAMLKYNQKQGTGYSENDLVAYTYLLTQLSKWQITVKQQYLYWFIVKVCELIDPAAAKQFPITPAIEERLGDWLRIGAQKYGEHNWEKGIPNSRCFASLKRHLLAWMQNREDDEDHPIATLCNAMFILHNIKAVQSKILPEKIDDMKCLY